MFLNEILKKDRCQRWAHLELTELLCMLKLHRFSCLKVVENKKFNNQIPYDQNPIMGTCHLKNAWVGEMDGHAWN